MFISALQTGSVWYRPTRDKLQTLMTHKQAGMPLDALL